MLHAGHSCHADAPSLLAGVLSPALTDPFTSAADSAASRASPNLTDLTAGGTIRFRIKGTDETCEVKVRRVTEYPDFEALLDGEGPSNVNPTATRELRLANIRAIYPSEKEALGALAIEIALLDSAP
ncbi:hypothetical protein [Streptomyces europaeiscabiei]|uniref:hypothetical protein n=1 Tax=Streptomyces europaeiscabiei TaxID=146819 RepID=UPI002E19E15D|nr:hypothetical protein OG858_19450 [Streptomyces europaeiscabiei]